MRVANWTTMGTISKREVSIGESVLEISSTRPKVACRQSPGQAPRTSGRFTVTETPKGEEIGQRPRALGQDGEKTLEDTGDLE